MDEPLVSSAEAKSSVYSLWTEDNIHGSIPSLWSCNSRKITFVWILTSCCTSHQLHHSRSGVVDVTEAKMTRMFARTRGNQSENSVSLCETLVRRSSLLIRWNVWVKYALQTGRPATTLCGTLAPMLHPLRVRSATIDWRAQCRKEFLAVINSQPPYLQHLGLVMRLSCNPVIKTPDANLRKNTINVFLPSGEHSQQQEKKNIYI